MGEIPSDINDWGSPCDITGNDSLAQTVSPRNCFAKSLNEKNKNPKCAQI